MIQKSDSAGKILKIRKDEEEYVDRKEMAAYAEA